MYPFKPKTFTLQLCPGCGKSFKKLQRHLNHSDSCQRVIDMQLKRKEEEYIAASKKLKTKISEDVNINEYLSSNKVESSITSTQMVKTKQSTTEHRQLCLQNTTSPKDTNEYSIPIDLDISIHDFDLLTYDNENNEYDCINLCQSNETSIYER